MGALDSETGVIVAVLLVIATAAAVALFGHLFPPRRYRRSAHVQRPDLSDPAEQLRLVMGARFSPRPVMSKGEYAVFRIAEQEAEAMRCGHRVFGQTSLGEILASEDSDAFRAVNSKRVDVLVIDRRGMAVLAIEFQGDGHYQGTAAVRDAVKKEALRKAGVSWLELTSAHGEDEKRSMIRAALNRTVPPAPETTVRTTATVLPAPTR
jgi:hypothetical protein